MKNSLKLVTSLLIAPYLFSFGEWEKIDDFEYEDPAEMWNTWFIGGVAADLAIAEILQDPADPENKALYFDINAYNTTLWILSAMIPKEEVVIPDGSEATLYFRWFWTGVDHATSPMLTDIQSTWLAPGEEGNNTDRPADFTVLNWEQRVNIHSNVADFGARTPFLDLYDNNQYRPALLPGGQELFEIPVGTWIEYWIHVNNAPGATGADEYSVYVKVTGEEQKRLIVSSASNPDLYFDTMLFRGQLAGDIRRFRYVSYTGPPTNRFVGDMTLLDDVYFDPTGLNLETPPDVVLPEGSVEFWNGQPLVRLEGGEAWVETPLLKWLGVDGDPWVWSDAFSTWLYLPEYSGLGAWTFVTHFGEAPGEGTGEVWNGLPIVTSADGSSWVDSPLLNWLMVDHDPWIWCDSLVTWLYLPEYDAAGAWVYVFPGG